MNAYTVSHLALDAGVSVHVVRDYMLRPKLFTGTNPNIINLSRSFAYQGAGYYASLLAEARQHRVLPNVETMIELSRKGLYRHALPELEDSLNRCLAKADGVGDRLLVCLGQTEIAALEPFARLLFDWYRAPILEVSLGKDSWRAITRIRVVPISDLDEASPAWKAIRTGPGGHRSSACR